MLKTRGQKPEISMTLEFFSFVFPIVGGRTVVGRPADGCRTVVGGARVVSGAHVVSGAEKIAFDRGGQMGRP